MGNEQCPDCKPDALEALAYGSYEIVEENHQFYAVVQKVMETGNQIKSQVLKQLQMRQAINCAHLVKLHNFILSQEPYGFRLKLFYEYVPKSLKHRIQELKESQGKFTEREIFAVLYGVETGLEALAKHKIKHCCINLETILCKNNVYKITDVSSTTYLTSYELAIKENRSQLLSQRLLEKLAYQSLHPIYTYEDDLFSLGMVGLAMASHRDPADFYVWQKNKGALNKKIVHECMKLAQRKYGLRLVSKIKSLLGEGNQDNQRSTNSKLHQGESDTSKLMIKGLSYHSTTLSPQKSLNALHM